MHLTWFTHGNTHVSYRSKKLQCKVEFVHPRMAISFPATHTNGIQSKYKKVLLREPKRHTARRVASARYADLSRGVTPSQVRGGTPSHVPGGTPSHVWGGTPSQVQGWYPFPGLGGYPIPGLGCTPLARPGMGYPPGPDLGWGTPLPSRPGRGTPPRNVNRQTPVKTVPSRHTAYAGGNYIILFVFLERKDTH